MRFRSLQARILFFFLGLFLLVELVTFLAVDTADRLIIRRQIEDQLVANGTAFDRLIEERTRQFVQGARAISHDHAFAEAVMSGHADTVSSALKSLQGRIGADHIVLVHDDTRAVFGDTSGLWAEGQIYPFATLVDEAEESPELTAAGHAIMGGTLYRLVVVPLLTPAPSAWFGISFRIDDTLAQRLQGMTLAHVTFLHEEEGGRVTVLASTLDPPLRTELAAAWSHAKVDWEHSTLLILLGSAYVTRSARIDPARGIVVVLKRSLDEALHPFQPLRTALILVGGAGLFFSLAGGIRIAQRVSRPVRTLVEGTQRIEQGNYGHRVDIRQQDEVGQLAESFNRMSLGLEERDRVRGLLGKVVSPAIAEELLRNRVVELGGEDRELSILFSDLRDFTTLSEGRPAQDVVHQLNAYFTRMSEVIERHGGVIDKYVGDAIMALFGAPLRCDDHADRALRAAIDMVQALDTLNPEFRDKAWPLLHMGIGINTAHVVVGNMGSPNRLNYTVMGDGVNLASRLEGLTKKPEYAARIIASETTLRQARASYRTRPLGAAQIKGKKVSAPIFAIDGLNGGSGAA